MSTAWKTLRGCAGSLIKEACEKCGGNGYRTRWADPSRTEPWAETVDELCKPCGATGMVNVTCGGCGEPVTTASFIGNDGYHYCAECAKEGL